MQTIKAFITVTSLLLLVGCGLSKWAELQDAEQLNATRIRIHCNSALSNAQLCAEARTESRSLAATRAQYEREEEEKCRRSWNKYDREEANFDRELAKYDRELDRYERNKEREYRKCDREHDRYERAMDRYRDCVDRQSSGSYSYCSLPSQPFCLASFSLRPSEPRTPREPYCSRP